MKSVVNKKQWIIKTSAPEEFFASLPTLNLSASGCRLVSQLLWNRGFKTRGEVYDFLNPNYETQLHDPLLLKGMEEAVERVNRAILQKEKIIVFADYDADGVCGAVILSEFLRATGADFEARIPDRFKEQYGLTMIRVEEFSQLGAGLIITIDCGVTDYDEIERARDLGMDVIVIDHHIVPPRWPRASAVVDYKQGDNTYPEKVLCGTGLTFKLIQGILQKENWGLPSGWEKWLLDCVAIATVADMVPLTGENRVLVKYGLLVLQKGKRAGLKKLLEIRGADLAGVSSETIAYIIAPRINAASRMDHANTAYELLTTENQAEAEWLAGRLDEKNRERRVMVDGILNELYQKLPLDSLPAVIFEGSVDWPAGVLGLAAARLVEKFQRPVFLYALNGATAKGSCRAPQGVNIVELMRSSHDLFLDFGGHALSGGFSIDPRNISLLQEKILARAEDLRSPMASDVLELDAELFLEDVDDTTFDAASLLEPFGQNNPRPIFLFKNILIKGIRRVGAEGEHAKVVLGERGIGAIFFRYGENNFRAGDRINIAATLQKNIWNGSRKIELQIVDAGFANE